MRQLLEDSQPSDVAALLGKAMACLYSDASDVALPPELKTMVLGYWYLHSSGTELRGNSHTVDVLMDSTKATLMSKWMPEARAAYFDVLYGLGPLPGTQTANKGGFLKRMLRRGKRLIWRSKGGRQAASAHQSMVQYAQISYALGHSTLQS